VNQPRRARYLERAALREAQKALRREGKESFTRDELLQLRIQSVEPWKRIVLGTLGTACSGTGVYVLFEKDAMFGGLFLVVFGIVFLLIGLIGHRKTIESCLEAIGNEPANGVIEAVFNALDGF
jgi:hypothetical protein